MGGALCVHEQEETEVVENQTAFHRYEGHDGPRSIFDHHRSRFPHPGANQDTMSESGRSRSSYGRGSSSWRPTRAYPATAPRRSRDEAPSGRPRTSISEHDVASLASSRSRSGRGNDYRSQSQSSLGPAEDDEEEWQQQENNKLEFLRHVKAHVNHSDSHYAGSDASWGGRSGTSGHSRARSARSARSARRSDRSYRSGSESVSVGVEGHAERPPITRKSSSATSGGGGIADLLESFAVLPTRLHNQDTTNLLTSPRTPQRALANDANSDVGLGFLARSGRSGSAPPRAGSVRSGRSGRSGGGRGGGSARSDGGRSEDDHGGGVLATLASESILADLESKLLMAQQKVDDLNHRCRNEEDRAKKAEAKLEQVRKETPGGSDLEFKLMQNLVELRARCEEFNKQAKDEDGKVASIAQQLAEERRQREEAEQEVSNLEQLKLSLVDRLDTLKSKTQSLEKELTDKSQHNEVLQRGLDVTARERDELLVLAKKALAHKEKEERDKLKKVGEVEKEKERILESQREEQDAILAVLGEVDQLVAKLGRGDVRETSDALRELSSIRHEMRQLIKQRRSLPGIKE
eukprot:TRINITY_DN18908_c0_g1_i1.p1 TRINITY_DN18908_c0_g1~~TRINITY_DN18908_c0_g1_i1.p1  ORF type:complete len:578 (-),score=113.42 TRINITY_DN18908_c0_g1_i1:264-1997(-)